MKKILIAAAFFCAVNVQAQTATKKAPLSPQERADRQTKVMTKKLSLNETQVEQIGKINSETNAKLEVPLNRTRADRQEIKAIRANREAAYEQVLTPTQLASYEQLKAEQRTRMAQKRNERKTMRQGTNAPVQQTQPQYEVR